MNSKRLVLAMVLGLSLAGCMSSGEKAASNQPASQVAGAAVNKYCLVDPTSPIDPKVTYMYNGTTYGFCCKDCITEFKKNPEKYIAAAK
jgi:YHS domain-containing protein